MSFLKKLFGIKDEKDQEDSYSNDLQNENLQSDNSLNEEILVEEDIEVVVNDQIEIEVVELVEEIEEDILEEKSLQQICRDVAEIIEQEETDEDEDLADFEIIPTIAEQKNAMNNGEIADANIDEVDVVEKEIIEELNSKEEKAEDIEEVSNKEENLETTAVEIENTIEDLEVSNNEVDAIELEETPIVEKKSFFKKLKEGVEKTRNSIFDNINTVFNMFTEIDEDLFEELEEALILADMGVDTSLFIINELRKDVKKNGITEVYKVKEYLINIISEILTKDDKELVIEPKMVILVIGVNGAGKTTTIGKLSHNYIDQGYSVTVAAADTFRAAAIDQLEVWADRTGANLIRRDEGSDPASVVFDACKSAKAKNTDILIVDTAGRLQNKKNLMEELKKINRIIEREYSDARKEVFLVLDSTTGQNAMQQAKLFNESAEITGLVLTKLDGTAKGGVIVSIKNELNVPVRYVGLGEKIDDLEEFNGKEFATAIFE